MQEERQTATSDSTSIQSIVAIDFPHSHSVHSLEFTTSSPELSNRYSVGFVERPHRAPNYCHSLGTNYSLTKTINAEPLGISSFGRREKGG